VILTDTDIDADRCQSQRRPGGHSVRVIIDADPGNGVAGADIDDSLAIGLALRSPEIQLEAITVVGGNVPVDLAVDCAYALLDAAGATHVPVHRGAQNPLVQDPIHWRTRLNTRRDDPAVQRLWADIAPPRPQSDRLHPTPAAQALVEAVDAAPGEITVVGIGPMTNIATAMLIDPEWARKVGKLVLMAGAFDMPNVLHELNAAYDPEATHLVLASAAPVTLIPLDVTTKTFMRVHDLDRLDGSTSELGRFLGEQCRPWVTWLADAFGIDGCALHDPLALAAALDPTLVRTRTASVGVELHGTLTRGRLVAWDADNAEILQAGLQLPTTVRPVTIASDVDASRFLRLLLDRLCD
jgi:inosine-uridine nucleoside N-ribohydrolase